MSVQTTFRIAAVQMDVQLGKVAENLGTILSRLRDATAQGANLVVFPECALSGYGFASREEGLSSAVGTDGPEIEKIAQACAELGVHCVLGLLERDGAKLFNAAALIGPKGLVGIYRKVHLPFMGVDRFVDHGDRPFEVLDAGGIRVGIHICYDAGFPEPGRVLSLLGADLLVVPTNWPTLTECAAEHVIPARAMENTVYAIAVNRVGEESGCRFIGRSSIVDPNGSVLAFGSPDREEILVAEIDVNRARRKHIVRVPGEREVNRIGDRRPGFYGAIVAPNGRD